MTGKQMLERLVELSEESQLARMVRGAKVRVGDAWFEVAEARGKIVLLDSEGQDISFSNLNVIEEVQWPSLVNASVHVSGAALAAVSGGTRVHEQSRSADEGQGAP